MPEKTATKAKCTLKVQSSLIALSIVGKNIEQQLMKKVFNRHQLTTIFGFCLVVSFLFSPSLIAQDAAAEEATAS